MKSFIATVATAVSVASAKTMEPHMFETKNTYGATMWFMDGLIYGLSGTMHWDQLSKCQGAFENAIQDYFTATSLIKQGKNARGSAILMKAW